ncbi:hypothetical protein H2200_006077 [Cladophialophora chaetospira]|uniref:acid phosphatase n=1 Tax=Cladophialophora chaetospira TaxID=386627 RepID=A0AA39CIS7_9EURO|nr:hypothetical protein H2200_006077 [Cladophialophora chaetospira]
MIKSVALLAAAGSLVAASPYQSPPSVSTIEPTLTQIEQSAATATSLSPVSNVKGLAFNRFFQIWLENTDYSAASGDPDQQFLASQGITLTNYFATTHPSEPNYCAAAGGDTFGMDNDDFHQIPANIATVVDLLETKGITWAEYQEDIPFAGFQGFNYSNQETFNNDYVRKHDPLILYKSITNNATRRELIKGFGGFQSDLANKTLPQWAFLTPNMTNDAHDTNVTFASTWLRSFVEPLMSNAYFWNNTLLLLTFDENESYGIQNKMFSILVGGAIPAHLKGTKDTTFYNHYSTIATVSQNWGLPSLGRWDCHANVFEIVANKTGYKNANVNTKGLFFNSSYPGPLSDKKYVPTWPNPTNSSTCAHGKGVLKSVVNNFKGKVATFNYTSPYPYDAKTGNDVP